MRFLFIASLMFTAGCQGFQGVADDMEKMIDNDAITIKVDKDAFAKETDIHVGVDVINKDHPQPFPFPAPSR